MRQWVYWVGGALLISLVIIYCSSPTHKEIRQEVQLFYDLQDTIKYYKNKDNSTSAQIKLLEADKKSLSKVLAARDKSLSDLLKSGSTQATVFSTVTRYDTVTQVKVDTVNAKPYFVDSTSNRWLTLKIELKDDSLRKSITFRDSISVSFKRVHQGFLKKKKSVVEVTNHNPYVKVDKLRSFNVKEKQSKSLFWVGVGVGAAGSLLLLK
jgi:hypothetical protein